MQLEREPELKKSKKAARNIAPLKYLCFLSLGKAIKDKSILKGFLPRDLYDEFLKVDTNTSTTHSLELCLSVRRTTQQRSVPQQRTGEVYEIGTCVDERVIPGPIIEGYPSIKHGNLDNIKSIASITLYQDVYPRTRITIEQGVQPQDQQRQPAWGHVDPQQPEEQLIWLD